MPIYEYRCENCNHELEAIQKMSDAPLTTCPECEHEALKKRVSAAAFRLKGGGWYETDFKSGNKKNIASGETAAGGGKADSGGTDSAQSKDSKPAAKSDDSKKSAPAKKTESSS